MVDILSNPSLQRLFDLEAGFKKYPGRRPGGSGPTGIGHASNIGHAPTGGMLGRQQAKDYGRMIQDQMEYEQLTNDAPLKVRHDPQTYGPSIDMLLGGAPYTGAVDPNWTDSRLREYTDQSPYRRRK